ncbi:UNVERIFIED_ORG: acyl-CoA synthetase (AMP-forming)/AMP-acid ligase II [Gordonia westfalica J30]
MINIATIVERNASRFPDRIAVIDGDRRVTHQELARRVRSVAHALQSMGVGRGDIVAVLLYNRIEFLEVMLAANRIGAAVMPMNYRLSPAEWAYMLGHSGAVAVLTEGEFESTVEGLWDRLPALSIRLTVSSRPPAGWTSYSALVTAHLGCSTVAVDVRGTELQRLMYTSGTTSRPKGVMLTHENILWKNLALIVEFGLTADDHTLICGPMYHVAAMDLPALATLHCGGGLTLLRKFSANGVLDCLERHRPTNAWLAPAMMNDIVDTPDVERRDTTSLRFVVGGGEKMPEPIIGRIEKAFPSVWFADAYGLTETASGDTVNDREHMRSKIGSVGRPVAHVDIAVVDADDRPLPANSIGEVVIRAPKVMAGYWRDEAATAAAIRNGWFHTGDIGKIDEDGFLYIEDRKKDMIISGGENIATPEVERVLYEHPSVSEAAVIGVPHERWGEVPKAFIVVRPGAVFDFAEIQEFCRRRLAKYKVPREIEVIEYLPRTPSGKVLKRDLRSGAVTRPT